MRQCTDVHKTTQVKSSNLLGRATFDRKARQAPRKRQHKSQCALLKHSETLTILLDYLLK